MSKISSINESVWSQKKSAMEYAKDSRPLPAEVEILSRYKKEMMNASLLDIGVGAGRTINFLSSACSGYVGIDYSPEMVFLAKNKFPTENLMHMDARNLSYFESSCFDIVWFSYNGIDYVSHDDRLTVLSEVRRVLKKGGLFIFSSHNRDSEIYSAWSGVNIKLSRNPVRLIKNLGKYVLGIFHSIKLGIAEKKTLEYAILNDSAQSYQLLTYYITPNQQLEQLRRAGFTVEIVMGLDGSLLQTDVRYTEGYSIYYVARVC